jgi:hypothetical protein
MTVHGSLIGVRPDQDFASRVAILQQQRQLTYAPKKAKSAFFGEIQS